MGEVAESTANPITNHQKIDPFFWRTGVNPTKIRLLDRWAIGERIVDVGCGNGAYAQYLRRAGFSVTAIDADDSIVDKGGIDFFLANVPPIPLPEKYCDTLVLFDVLEHVIAEEQLLREIKRVTRQRLILSVPSDDDGILPLYGLCHLHHIDKSHQREYNPAVLGTLLTRHGFQIVHIEPQYPGALPLIVGPFFVHSLLGKSLQFVTLLWLRFLRKTGIIQVNLPADWFVIADLASE